MGWDGSDSHHGFQQLCDGIAVAMDSDLAAPTQRASVVATPGARPSVSQHLLIGVVLLILVVAIFLVLQTDVSDAVGWVLFLLGIASLIGGVAFVASGLKKR